MSVEARNRPLPDWFTRVRTHQTVLPRFQRFEAWSYSDVNQMFNTVLQDLPIGSLLILEVAGEEPFVSRPMKGAPEQGERVTEHVLDGQQRLTALWRGLHNNYEDRTYFIQFGQEQETGMSYSVTSIARWTKEGENEVRPYWANNPAKQWTKRLVPLELAAPAIEAQQNCRDWLRKAIDDQEKRDRVSDQITEIRQKFASFNLPFMSLPVTTPKETALDVFIKMNTSAAPLSRYDIVVAQVGASLGVSLCTSR
ncbi:MAG: GmrSD restriction endonuclease domain-containing protein [Gemmatimonadaceae bacterium]